MSDFDVTIENVKAALVRIRETPVPEGEDPFWLDKAEQYLSGLLERLENEAMASHYEETFPQ